MGAKKSSSLFLASKRQWMSSRESSINPTAAEVTSSSAPKSDPAAEDVADTLAPEEKCKQTADTKHNNAV